jgi:serine/threonine-protein kinase HipA
MGDALSDPLQADIAVPVNCVKVVAKKPVLMLRRFDREHSRHIPFLSAMSMLCAKDNDTRSYLEIVDALLLHGAAPKKDMEALWRRMVFNILISNTDDHLRNHGFLYVGQEGWRLSPAYDLNPVPVDIEPRILTTAINLDDDAASLALAMDVAGYFDLDAAKAKKIAAEVGKTVSRWRDEAVRHGLTKNEIDRIASAFEHIDLKEAARLLKT